MPLEIYVSDISYMRNFISYMIDSVISNFQCLNSFCTAIKFYFLILCYTVMRKIELENGRCLYYT